MNNVERRWFFYGGQLQGYCQRVDVISLVGFNLNDVVYFSSCTVLSTNVLVVFY